jgi:prepilin-type N-terminal cleavage/methylation domain-containing protein/prepilin-type processing-associated H-X9-DG protein
MPYDSRPRHIRRAGFTLVELLVVIGVIAILIGLLTPALSRARYEANLTNCASNERQLVVAMTAYASDNGGYFPRQDANISGGDNPGSVSPLFWSLMTKTYGVPQSAMFCPLEPPDQVANYAYFGLNRLLMFGYALWVPRYDLAFQPPDPAGLYPPTSNTWFNLVNDPSGSAAGPISVRDPVGRTAPVLTDVATTVYYNPPSGHFDDPSYPVTDYNLGWPGGYYHFTPSNRPGPMNEAFADGHVERVEPHAIALRYTQEPSGPWYNWR